jgi:hypothetical protein
MKCRSASVVALGTVLSGGTQSALPAALLEARRGSGQSERRARLSQLGSVLVMTTPSPSPRPWQPSP